MIKKIIKNIFKFFGYNVNKITKEIEEMSINEILTTIIPEEPIIFDIGSNKGQSIEIYKKLFVNPKIHAFEPSLQDFQILKKKYDSDNNIFLNNFALGDKKEKKIFNVMVKSDTSSFLDLNKDSNWLKHRSKELNIPSENFKKNSIEAQINTLDNYIKLNKINKINLVKIDTQGYEENILKGSLESIKNNIIDAILTEIMFDDVYDKHLSFINIEQHLIQNNFRMAGINLTNNNIFKGLVFFADVIYVNKRILKLNK